MTEDIYLRTASETFGVPVEEVTESQRRFAKDLCFAKAYGGCTTECRILRSNFQTALAAAIHAAEQNGAGQSGYAVGLRDVLEASRRGERIVVRDE